MPKVEYVKARKDYPEFGIVKGQEHYVWSMKRQRGGVTKRSLTKPKPSQLTESEYKSAAYELQERLSDTPGEGSSISELESWRDDMAEAFRELAGEQQEKFDNMPEGFQQGSTGELLQERISACESAADELEAIDFEEFEASEPEEGEEQDEEPVNADGETEEEYIAGKLSELQGVSFDVE